MISVDFGFLSAVSAWLTGASFLVVGGLILGLVIPFTFVVVFPTNKSYWILL